MRRVQLRDVELNVYDQGKGMPVLFVHGFPLSHEMWQAQLDEFSSQYRVIAPDLRGFGGSTVTPGTVTMQQFADDLATLLDVLGVTEPVVYCGLSMGGYIGWRFLETYPTRVRALILCDTRALPDSEAAAATRHTTAQGVVSDGAGLMAKLMVPNIFASTTSKERPAVIEKVKQTVLKTDPQGIAAGLRGMAARPDSTYLLSTIRVPTLVICGDQDKLAAPDEMRGMAEAIDGAEFLLVPDAGHMAPTERPEIVNPAIKRFLEALK